MAEAGAIVSGPSASVKAKAPEKHGFWSPNPGKGPAILVVLLVLVGIFTLACLIANSHESGLFGFLTGDMTNWSVAHVINTGGAYNINVGEMILFFVGAALIAIGIYTRGTLGIIAGVFAVFFIADAICRCITGSDIL